MIKCIIADDEPNAVSLLELLIGEATGWQVVARCYNGLEALQAAKTTGANLIFLDINMPQLNGMELAALLPRNIKIVFTTAYAEYAAESYLLDALDYVLKPITLKRFLSAQQKIETYFCAIKQDSPARVAIATEEVVAADYLFVKTNKTHQKVHLQNILYIEGDKEYIRVITTTGELLVFKRMKTIEEQLSHPFIRVHNSYIVNLEHMEKFADNHIIVADARIPVSDKYRARFLEYLNGKLF